MNVRKQQEKCSIRLENTTNEGDKAKIETELKN
jgi:hypothetical protein